MRRLNIDNYGLSNEEYFFSFRPFCIRKRTYLTRDKKAYIEVRSKNYWQILKAFFYRLIRRKYWYYFLIRSLDYKQEAIK